VQAVSEKVAADGCEDVRGSADSVILNTTHSGASLPATSSDLQGMHPTLLPTPRMFTGSNGNDSLPPVPEEAQAIGAELASAAVLPPLAVVLEEAGSDAGAQAVATGVLPDAADEPSPVDTDASAPPFGSCEDAATAMDTESAETAVKDGCAAPRRGPEAGGLDVGAAVAEVAVQARLEGDSGGDATQKQFISACPVALDSAGHETGNESSTKVTFCDNGSACKLPPCDRVPASSDQAPLVGLSDVPVDAAPSSNVVAAETTMTCGMESADSEMGHASGHQRQRAVAAATTALDEDMHQLEKQTAEVNASSFDAAVGAAPVAAAAAANSAAPAIEPEMTTPATGPHNQQAASETPPTEALSVRCAAQLPNLPTPAYSDSTSAGTPFSELCARTRQQLEAAQAPGPSDSISVRHSFGRAQVLTGAEAAMPQSCGTQPSRTPPRATAERGEAGVGDERGVAGTMQISTACGDMPEHDVVMRESESPVAPAPGCAHRSREAEWDSFFKQTPGRSASVRASYASTGVSTALSSSACCKHTPAVLCT
jgi:hypothetical protein